MVHTHHMNVRPVFPGPLYWRVPTICVLVCPSCLCTENTVEKMSMPHIRLTMLFMTGVALPSFTAPWLRFMNVAYVRKVPSPAPMTMKSEVYTERYFFPSCHASQPLTLKHFVHYRGSCMGCEIHANAQSLEQFSLQFTCIPSILGDSI